jgi:hypothetical protein
MHVKLAPMIRLRGERGDDLRELILRDRVAEKENGGAHPHGAFMEPSRRNQWQTTANRSAAETAKTSQIRCPGLRLVAVGVKW